MRKCLDCPALGQFKSRCDPCRLKIQRAKDKTPERRNQKSKYDTAHRKLRASWLPAVASGTVSCWRCGEPIRSVADYELGHRRGLPSHPEHLRCNRTNSNESKELT